MTSEISLRFIFLGLIALAVFLEVLADIFLKKWSLDNSTKMFVLGMFVYTTGTVFWAISLKYNYLSKAVSVFTVLNLVAVVLVGVIFFKEDLSFMNIAGIILGVISVILIQI